jgi:hypothetical protein
LRVFDKSSRASNARSLARAVVLLFLVAHADLVTITHNHGEAQRVPRAAVGCVENMPGGGSSGPFGTNRHKCLSCYVQSNFVIDIRPISIPPHLCLEPVSPELFISEPGSSGVSLVLSDRAPPLG